MAYYSNLNGRILCTEKMANYNHHRGLHFELEVLTRLGGELPKAVRTSSDLWELMSDDDVQVFLADVADLGITEACEACASEGGEF